MQSLDMVRLPHLASTSHDNYVQIGVHIRRCIEVITVSIIEGLRTRVG